MIATSISIEVQNSAYRPVPYLQGKTPDGIKEAERWLIAKASSLAHTFLTT